MRVFVTGGTGTVGLPIVAELVSHGHKVIALARSTKSAERLSDLGAQPLIGDLRDPTPWIDVLGKIDAIIHAAATFEDDMGIVDDHLIASMISEAANHTQKLKFIYTGGCWLYGDTGGKVATEQTLLNPVAGFEWMVKNMKTMLDAPAFDTCVIHPANVYDRDTGAISRFIENAKNGQPIKIWSSPDIHWTMVHRQDLARAYRLVLENGEPGQCYNVASERFVRVGDLASAVASRFNGSAEVQIEPVETGIAELGEWVRGTALDQKMSSEKIIQTLGWSPRHPNTCAEVS